MGMTAKKVYKRFVNMCLHGNFNKAHDDLTNLTLF